MPKITSAGNVKPKVVTNSELTGLGSCLWATLRVARGIRLLANMARGVAPSGKGSEGGCKLTRVPQRVLRQLERAYNPIENELVYPAMTSASALRGPASLGKQKSEPSYQMDGSPETTKVTNQSSSNLPTTLPIRERL